MKNVALLADPAAARVVLDPLRSRIVGELREPGSAASVARTLELPRQRVAYHVRQLEEAGVLEHVEDRRRGNCTERIVRATARSYLVAPAALGDLAVAPGGAVDRFSSVHLVAQAMHTVEEVSRLRDAADRAGKRLATLSLVSDVRVPTPAAQHAFATELAEAVARVVARHHVPDAPGGRSYRVHLGVHPARTEAPPTGAPPAEAPPAGAPPTSAPRPQATRTGARSVTLPPTSTEETTS